MRRAIVAMLLAVVSSNAAAAWVEVAHDETQTFYANPTTIRKTGNLVTMWDLIDFKTAQEVPTGSRKLMLSIQGEYEYDCRKGQARSLYDSWHPEHMGAGEVIYFQSIPTRWEAVALAGTMKVFWKIACGKL